MSKTRHSDLLQQGLSGITLVIPAFEPTEGLIDIVQQLSCFEFSSIVVVDDGSGSGSENIFTELAALDGVTVVKHKRNLGKGAALKSAFRHIINNNAETTNHIITLDADGQHSVDDIVAVANECLSNGNRMIIGVRSFSRDVPLRSRFGNLLTRRVLRWIGNVDLDDTQSGLRCIPLAFAAKTLRIASNRYDFELACILLAKESGLPITQHSIKTIYIDDNESSHFRPILDSLRIYFVFARFTTVAVISFLLDISLFTLFHYSSSNIIASTYAARFFSGSFNFLCNKHLVFHSRERHRYLLQAVAYVTLAVVIASLSGIVVDWLYQLLGWHAPLVKILVDSQLFILSFVMQRFVVFRK